jgi:NADH-quinone oxidoreductase subunit J
VTGEIIAFWAVAIILVASSLAVVLTRNLFHSVLFLAVALVVTGVVFLLLDAAFLFGVQLLLYAGGVVTIVVFAIMLTERLIGERMAHTSRHIVNGAIVSGAFLVAILGFLAEAALGRARPPLAVDPTKGIGQAIVGPYAVAVELLGVLLVGALLGALYFARSED